MPEAEGFIPGVQVHSGKVTFARKFLGAKQSQSSVVLIPRLPPRRGGGEGGEGVACCILACDYGRG